MRAIVVGHDHGHQYKTDLGWHEVLSHVFPTTECCLKVWKVHSFSVKFDIRKLSNLRLFERNKTPIKCLAIAKVKGLHIHLPLAKRLRDRRTGYL